MGSIAPQTAPPFEFLQGARLTREHMLLLDCNFENFNYFQSFEQSLICIVFNFYCQSYVCNQMTPSFYFLILLTVFQLRFCFILGMWYTVWLCSRTSSEWSFFSLLLLFWSISPEKLFFFTFERKIDITILVFALERDSFEVSSDN